MRNAGLDEAQAGIKIAGRNINNLRYADNTTLMAESEEELTPLPHHPWHSPCKFCISQCIIFNPMKIPSRDYYLYVSCPD